MGIWGAWRIVREIITTARRNPSRVLVLRMFMSGVMRFQKWRVVRPCITPTRTERLWRAPPICCRTHRNTTPIHLAALLVLKHRRFYITQTGVLTDIESRQKRKPIIMAAVPIPIFGGTNMMMPMYGTPQIRVERHTRWG